MGKAMCALVLVLLMTCSAQAGYIQNEAPAPPPPPPSQPMTFVAEPTHASEESFANGYMQNDAPSGLTQIAFEVLAVLPSLL